MDSEKLPAIQIPVLMLFNLQEPLDSNIFCMFTSCDFCTGRISFSVRNATGESKKNAPIRIQSASETEIKS